MTMVMPVPEHNIQVCNISLREGLKKFGTVPMRILHTTYNLFVALPEVSYRTYHVGPVQVGTKKEFIFLSDKVMLT